MSIDQHRFDHALRHWRSLGMPCRPPHYRSFGLTLEQGLEVITQFSDDWALRLMWIPQVMLVSTEDKK